MSKLKKRDAAVCAIMFPMLNLLKLKRLTFILHDQHLSEAPFFVMCTTAENENGCLVECFLHCKLLAYLHSNKIGGHLKFTLKN